MFGIAVLSYFLAVAIPVYLLRHFHSQSWYWHVLAALAAVGIGFMPAPAAWNTPGSDLIFGFAFVLLLVWGVGGLVLGRPRLAKHT
jgi:hypothetical protein